MEKIRPVFFVLPLTCLMLAAACSTTSASEPAPPPTFAQAICADCHAIKALHLSPNPSAPTFVDIVNREGVSKQALKRFLSDAHNYPEAMDFDLEPEHVELLSDYMMTLKDPAYQRTPY